MKAEETHFTFQVEKLSLGLIINLEDLGIQAVIWHQAKICFEFQFLKPLALGME